MKKWVWTLAVVLGLGMFTGCENIATDAVQEAERAAGIVAKIIRGTAGNDTLKGTSAAEKIYGLEGDDLIFGNFGEDIIYGGPGQDIINDGNGTIYFGDGNDVIYGESGDDVIYVLEPRGNDAVYPGTGTDIIRINKINTQDSVTFDTGNDLVELMVRYSNRATTSKITLDRIGSAMGPKKMFVINSGKKTLRLEQSKSSTNTIFYVKTSDNLTVYTIEVIGEYYILPGYPWIDIVLVQ